MSWLDKVGKVVHNLINPVASVANVVGDYVSQNSANKQVDKQIAAQREENEKARAHNLMLAQMQNKWNLEQWAKENEYNSPSAQMARYMAAGLNPNLIYGQSNTSAQLSGSLSSGAPASPADMSAYGRKGSAVGKALENLDPFMYEQLRGMRLDNDMKQENLNVQKYETAFQDFLHNANLSTEEIQNILDGATSPRKREALQGLMKANYDAQNAILDIDLKQIEKTFKSESYKLEVEKIAQELKITTENANYLAQKYIYSLDEDRFRAQLAEQDAIYKKHENEWMPWEKGIGLLCQGVSAAGDVITLTKLLNLFGVKGNKFKKLRKTGENTYTWE